MAFDRAFNTPLILFTAFGGEMISDVPKFTWVGRSNASLGMPSGVSLTNVYGNGKAFITVGYSSGTYYISYFDFATKTWQQTFSINGENHIFGGNGVFLWVYGSSMYSAFNGNDWRYAGYLTARRNPAMCLASNGTGGVVSCWFVDNPVYAKGDVSNSGDWTIVGTYDKDGICCFTSMTCHKGLYVGVASDTVVGSNKGGIQISTNGYRWVRTLQYPPGYATDNSCRFGEIRSVGNRLFLQSNYSYDSGGNFKYCYRLNVISDNAASYKTVYDFGTNSFHLESMVYVAKLGLYILFTKTMIYSSPDGYSWKAAEKCNFYNAVVRAIYIPGDGFYVSTESDWGSNSTYYCAYP
jgi:hypothetical protein